MILEIFLAMAVMELGVNKNYIKQIFFRKDISNEKRLDNTTFAIENSIPGDNLKISQSHWSKLAFFSVPKNSEGLSGIGERLKDSVLVGKAISGNCFSLFSHAEAVAKNLNFPVAIVEKKGLFYLYEAKKENNRILTKNLDSKVISVVDRGKNIYHPGFTSVAESKSSKLAYAQGNKIMINEREFKMAGLNVYDLAFVAERSQTELEKTLKAIAESGANTVRFWAFSIHEPEIFCRILDTSVKLNLPLKFIPVFGNHWQDMEAPAGKFIKKDDWYQEGYKKNYLPHVEKTVKALIEKDNILTLELMNEPEGEHTALRNFADEVSTKIRRIYEQFQQDEGKEISRHLISLGTLGGPGRRGMVGAEYLELFGLPNIDLLTAHDYTFDLKQSGEDNLSPVYQKYIDQAKALNKPFFLGEIGIKVRENGAEGQKDVKPVRSTTEALEIIDKKFNLYLKQGISGVLLWGPQPLGYSVDGAGFGFSFQPGDPVSQKLKKIFSAAQ